MLINDALKGLRYEGRISVRRKEKQGIVYVGGGSPALVMRRYGYCTITGACILEGALILYIEERI